MIKDKEYIAIIKKWIKEFVIRYTICPFARIPFENGLIRYWVCHAVEAEEVLLELATCFTSMMTSSQEKLSNGFLILPNFGKDFQLLMDINDYGNLLLEDMKLESQLQIVAFHPNFRFADEEESDNSNFVNRSPIAMLHILRTHEVEEAISSHPDISKVPDRNKKLLKNLPSNEIAKILSLIGHK